MSLTVDSVQPLDFLAALRDTLRVALPEAKKVHLERVDLAKASLPLLTIEIIAYESTAINAHLADRTLDLDIIYFSADNEIAEGLRVLERLSSVLPHGLPVKDRYIHVTEGPEIKFVDQDLHMLITYRWYDGMKRLILTDEGHLADLNEGDNLDNTQDEAGVETEVVVDDGTPVDMPVVDDDSVAHFTIEKMETLIIELENE